MKSAGRSQITSKLNRMSGPEKVRRLGAALFQMADNIAVAAQISISRGAVSGKAHVPSAPGQPPNYDTGVLANNIEAVQLAPLKTAATSNAPYATHLELGTSKMGARPYMRPAKLATDAENRETFRRAAKSITKGR